MQNKYQAKKVMKAGNSLVVSIPAAIVRLQNIKQGDMLIVTVEKVEQKA
jgi:antitoxin component of MazEF toxin-antitoxin module